MKYFEKQPLFTFTLAFTAGTFLLALLSSTARIAVSALSILILLTAVCLKFSKRIRIKEGLTALIAVSLSLFFASVLSIVYHDVKVANQTDHSGTNSTIVAVINDEVSLESFASVYAVSIREIDGEDADILSILTFPYELVADIGDTIMVKVDFTTPSESLNGFPLKRYYASKNIHICANAVDDDITFLKKEEGIKYFFTNLSSRLSARLRFRLGDEYGGLASGLLLGRRNDISDAAKRDFRFLGITHILSVSGLHLSIIAGGLLSLLKRFRSPAWLRFTLCSFMIVFMILVTGMPASVIRSGIMMFLMLLASLIGRKEEPINSLFIASASILLFSPSSVYDVGFILSFSATLGLITLGRYLSSAIFSKTGRKMLPIRILGKVLASLSVTLSAVIFTLPFLYCFFGEMSIVSFLSNLIFVPVSGIFLFVSIGALILPNAFLGNVFCFICKFLSRIILDLAGYLSNIVPEPISLRTPEAYLAIAIACVSLVSLVFVKKKRVIHILIPFAVWCAVFSASTVAFSINNRDNVDVIAVNLKKNDFILVKSEGKTLLCDFSDGRYSQANNALSLAETELYDTSVDVILLTHLHSYHKSTFKRLADNNRISTVILPMPSNDDGKAVSEEICSIAYSLGIDVLTYSAEESSTVTFADCNIVIEPAVYLDRSVQPINILSIETGDGCISYIGASAFESNIDVLKIIKRSDTILLGIHGPNIKIPISKEIRLGNTYVSNDSVNEGYATYFDVINDGTKYFIRFYSD